MHINNSNVNEVFEKINAITFLSYNALKLQIFGLDCNIRNKIIFLTTEISNASHLPQDFGLKVGTFNIKEIQHCAHTYIVRIKQKFGHA